MINNEAKIKAVLAICLFMISMVISGGLWMPIENTAQASHSGIQMED